MNRPKFDNQNKNNTKNVYTFLSFLSNSHLSLKFWGRVIRTDMSNMSHRRTPFRRVSNEIYMIGVALEVRNEPVLIGAMIERIEIGYDKSGDKRLLLEVLIGFEY